ncbi:MAG TPA: LytR C-terminal domain-containing protein [Gemmatimonas sp.]|nr:LytR C-terminal domain-containing protein [Gemmatimonas sp.]
MPQFPAPLEPTRGNRSGWIALALMLLVIIVSAGAWWQRSTATPGVGEVRATVPVTDPSARAPEGERIRVRVINGTRTRGLARRATLLLRDFGYDVVDFDTDTRRNPEQSVIEVHTGKTEIADRVKRILGTGDISTVLDSLRYVDLTVVVGRDWQPPSQPLRP